MGRDNAPVKPSVETSRSGPWLVCFLAGLHSVLFYVLGVILARLLGPEGFGDYSVAVSVATIGTPIATLGLAKFALRVMSAERVRRDWAHDRGFIQFSIALVAGMGVVLAVVSWFVFLAVEPLLGEHHNHRALVILLTFLPALALFKLMLEIATGNGSYVWSTLIYRAGVPTFAIALVGGVVLLDWPMHAGTAALCYGAAWAIALVLMIVVAVRVLPKGVWKARPAYSARSWLAYASGYMSNAVLLAVMSATGILVMEMVGESEAQVGLYAAVAQTANMIILVSTSTNRFYMPQVSRLIETGDEAGYRALLRRRKVLLLVICGGFLLVMIVLGHPILKLFGHGFEHGHLTLVLLSIGTCVNTYFALAPPSLLFLGRHRLSVGAMIIATVASIVISFPLVLALGPSGAALGHTIPIVALYLFQSRVVATIPFEEMCRCLQPEPVAE